MARTRGPGGLVARAAHDPARRRHRTRCRAPCARRVARQLHESRGSHLYRVPPPSRPADHRAVPRSGIANDRFSELLGRRIDCTGGRPQPLHVLVGGLGRDDRRGRDPAAARRRRRPRRRRRRDVSRSCAICTTGSAPSSPRATATRASTTAKRWSTRRRKTFVAAPASNALDRSTKWSTRSSPAVATWRRSGVGHQRAAAPDSARRDHAASRSGSRRRSSRTTISFPTLPGDCAVEVSAVATATGLPAIEPTTSRSPSRRRCATRWRSSNSSPTRRCSARATPRYQALLLDPVVGSSRAAEGSSPTSRPRTAISGPTSAESRARSD